MPTNIMEAESHEETRYRRLFETAKDAIMLIDGATAEILDVNRHSAELFGYSTPEFLGKTIWELPPFRSADLGRRLWEALQHTEVVREEGELPRKDGSLVAVELLCNRYKENGREVIQANIRDISERRQAEAALRDSEERFRVLVEGVKDYAIFMTDAQAKIVSWNRGAERILGYSGDEILGRDSKIVFTPEDRERGEPQGEMETAVRDGRAEDERWHLRKDGSRFFASGVMTPLWHPDGKLRGFAKIMRDVTERKNNEEAMREAQKLESIGLLAGGVAHDFNNLLTGIIGSASLAAEELPRLHPSRLLVESVITAGKRAADLTAQLLAYAGKGKFAIEIFSVSNAVSEIIELIHASVPENIELKLRLGTGLPPIEADRTQIQQIAMNLVINAAEAIDGAGVIRISTGHKQLTAEELVGAEIAHLPPGDYVFLEVEDSGTGMSQETKARIFDPFFTTKFTGRGLGLAAVSGIVRAHRGAIHVSSAPRQGTTFRVFLPVTERPPQFRHSETAEPVSGRETILVVDDDELVRRVSQQALERRGYRVRTATNGKEAVELVRGARADVDLVVMDLAMPVMDGEEAHRALKEIRPDLPILISSGYSEAIASSRFGDRGMDAFIQKPYTADQLAARVKKTLAEVVR
ncbi:MAG: PAS domain S-box protein [Bryobacteraceae bacterium]